MSENLRKTRHVLVSLGLVGVCILFVVLLVKGLTLNPQNIQSTLIGQPAKEFTVDVLQGGSWLTQADGQLIQLKDLKGKPVVLNFWASWCVSCREEARFFEEFWQRHKDAGVLVVGIAIQDTPEAAKAFASGYGKTYPLGLDTSGKAGIDFGVYGVPETFFIDKQGVIKHKETGAMSVELLEEKLALIM